LHVAGDEPMMLEGHSQAMRGGAGETCARDQPGQRRWPGLESGQHHCGFVENADSARVVHELILPYRIVRRKWFRLQRLAVEGAC
jgi:hypothetical protein